MFLKKSYYYFYYKLYKSTNPSSLLPRQFRAILYLDVLFIFAGLSLVYLYGTFFNPNFNLGNGKWLIVLYIAIICIPNYLIFEHNDQWKEIVDTFDKLPKKTNQIGGFITWSIVVIIILNLIFSIYLMARTAQVNHTGRYSKGYIEQNHE